MGYCVKALEIEIVVPVSKIGEAETRLQQFYCDEKDTRLEQLLHNEGWDNERDKEGNVVINGFGSDKVGPETEEMWGIMAEYIRDGGYAYMQGEDGNRWRWVFYKGELHSVGLDNEAVLLLRDSTEKLLELLEDPQDKSLEIAAIIESAARMSGFPDLAERAIEACGIIKHNRQMRACYRED